MLNHRSLAVALAAIAVLPRCDCAEPPGANEGEGDVANEGEGDVANEGEGDIANEGEGEGDPLEEDLATFCAGSGAVVNLDGSGQCGGDLAADSFRFAVCACEDVVVGSNLSVDAFDSREGPYGADLGNGQVNVIADGQLGLDRGPLVLGNQMNVKGSVFVGGGGLEAGPSSTIEQNLFAFGPLTDNDNPTSLTIGRNAFVNGDVAGGYVVAGVLSVPDGATVSGGVVPSDRLVRRAIPEQAPCPCAPDEIVDIAAIVDFGAAHRDNDAVDPVVDPGFLDTAGDNVDVTLPCGRFYVTGINTGSLTLHITDRTVLFVDGPVVTNGLSVVLDNDDAEIDLFVDGPMTINGNLSLGSQARPAAVRTYVSGDVSIQASATIGGNLYAPAANLVLDASAEVFGSLFVNSVTFSGSARLHFDSAIRDAGDSCPVDVGGEGEGDVGVGEGEGDVGVGEGEGDVGVGEGEGDVGGACSFDACIDDLDCCPPFFCVANQCVTVGG